MSNSSCSKEPTNSSNSSKSKSFLIISTKLEGGLQSILGSFNQFLFTNINLFNFFDYKQHLLKFVNIPTKEKTFSIAICDLIIPRIWWAKKSTTRNMLHFCSLLKKALDFLGI
jgi:hypothetical protein